MLKYTIFNSRTFHQFMSVSIALAPVPKKVLKLLRIQCLDGLVICDMNMKEILKKKIGKTARSSPAIAVFAIVNYLQHDVMPIYETKNDLQKILQFAQICDIVELQSWVEKELIGFNISTSAA